MSTSRPEQRFRDIIKAIDDIRTFIGKSSKSQFNSNIEKRYAVHRALLIISEAASKLGEQGPELAPGAPWGEIRGLGNFIRHEYDGVNDDFVWIIVTKQLVPLRAECVSAIKALQQTGPK